MIFVFDLDDTLYDEITYVKSGFKAVANHLAKQHKINPDLSFKLMCELLIKHGRGKIFDLLLENFAIKNKKNIKVCISAYRRHKPQLYLFSQAVDCLKRFEKYKKYIVTDGNKIVQYNKIKALKLDKLFDGYYITHRFGIKHSKPSAYCFFKICKKENVDPSEVLYVADNPKKDFVGIKPHGFKTIRVLTGGYKDLKMCPHYEAEKQINSLDELTPDIFL